MNEFTIKLINRLNQEHIAKYNIDKGSLLWADGTPLIPAVDTTNKKKKSTGIKQRNPSTIKMSVGAKCNMKCTYCCAANREDYDSRRLSPETLVSQITGLYDDPISVSPKVTLLGGEPLVYKQDLFQFIPLLRKNIPNIKIRAVTNGLLLDPEWAKFFIETNTEVSISHDGPMQTQNRGKDPLDSPAAVQAIKEMVLAGTNLTFSCVITDGCDIPIVRAYISEKTHLHENHIHMMTEGPLNGGGNTANGNAFDAETLMKDTLDDLRWMRNRNPQAVDRMKKIHSILTFQTPLEDIESKCIASKDNAISLGFDGQIYRCHSGTTAKNILGKLTDISSGTVRHTEEIQMWKKHKECQNCPAVAICGGGCLIAEEEGWAASCKASRPYYIGILAGTLYYITGYLVTEISNDIETITIPQTIEA
jgi:radical SAM protein with 4Fe4S-binding SPASM domain